MPEQHKAINRWDWDAMLDLFEAVTGYKTTSVVAGTLRVVSRADDKVVAEFQTFEPETGPHGPGYTYTGHTVHLHAGEELEEAQP